MSPRYLTAASDEIAEYFVYFEQPVMVVPNELVPKIRALLAGKRRA